MDPLTGMKFICLDFELLVLFLSRLLLLSDLLALEWVKSTSVIVVYLT